MSDAIRLQVSDLRVRVPESGEEILKGVSLELRAGQVFALVGESGSGKSVTSLAVMRLLPDALAITGGAVRVPGEQREQDLFELSESAMQTVRGATPCASALCNYLQKSVFPTPTRASISSPTRCRGGSSNGS